MKKRPIRGYMCLIMICIFLTQQLCGCSFGKMDADGTVKILYIITSVDDVYRKKLSDAIMEKGEAEKIRIDMHETKGNPDTEARLVISAREKGYDAIICRLGDNANAQLTNRSSDDLPIVYVNNQPAEEHLESNKFIFVGSNEEEAGKFQAEYVISRLGTGAMNVAILEGEKGHSATIGRTEAVKATLKNHGVNANYVYVDYADWSKKLAEEKFTRFIKTNPKVDAVFCNNDAMALGVIDSMKDLGLDYTRIPVVGVDATKEACESIVNGEMSFTVLQDAKKQGTKAVEAAVALAQGEDILEINGATSDRKYIWVDFEAVTIENVNKYMDSNR